MKRRKKKRDCLNEPTVSEETKSEIKHYPERKENLCFLLNFIAEFTSHSQTFTKTKQNKRTKERKERNMS